MPSSLQRFRAYEIAEDPGGASLELWRTDREVVCLASMPESQRWVELHVLAGVDTQDPAALPAVEGFRAQVQALLRLRDRRVLEVVEAGEDEGALFYVSEFVDGETLDSYLARCTPLPAWWAVEMARQLTLGLLALRRAPALLASAQVFNARLTLEGEATTDALVKLADFDLGGPPAPTPVDAAATETRAVKDVGRLLCYALSGLVAEQITPRQFSTLPLPSEVSDLLSRLLGRPGRSSPADLPGLLASLTACALTPSLAAAPARFPPALRPRLPLTAHFPTLPRLATELGDRLRLERSAFDAAQPYAQLGFAGAEPVTVQLLPPARLLTPAYLPLIRQAAERATARPTPHVLRVLELAAIDDPGWFLEEAAPRLSLDRARRLRRSLSPGEAAFLMREVDQAVLALETRGLPAAALCPQAVFLDFPPPTENLAGDEALAGQPVHAWPSFKIKLRAHPVAVELAQPRRFLRERLLDPCPPRPATERPVGPPVGLGSPNAADYAALFTWLCGGPSAVPAELAALVTGTLAGTAPITRAAMLDALTPLIPRPAKPSAAHTKSTSAVPTRNESVTAPAKKKGKGRRGKTTATATQKPAPATSSPAVERPAVQTPPTAPPPTHAGFLSVDPESAWENDGGIATEVEGGGFAEVLLGSRSTSAVVPASESMQLGPFESSSEEPTEDLPVGTLFGAWSGADDDTSDLPASEDRGFDFSPRAGLNHGRGPWRLIVLVVIVALVIAVLMAHFTGLAPWR